MKTSISQLGEFELIGRITRDIKVDRSIVKGIGDDAAVIKFTKDNYLLFSCDMLIEDVDFTLKANPFDVGHRALASCISDIAAMGGEVRYALVSLGLPKNTSINFVDRLYKGINHMAGVFDINIVGGDISKSKEIVIDVSMIGEVEKECLVLRSQAKIGDFIFVTGRLGTEVSFKRNLRKFIPRLKEARYLVKNYKINAMIDISDGLASDLKHITQASKVGAIIYEDLIPRYKNSLDLSDVLYRGEDFELLFTLSSQEAKKLMNCYQLGRRRIGRFQAKRLTEFSWIGEIIEKNFGVKIIKHNCKEELLEPKGFRHF